MKKLLKSYILHHESSYGFTFIELIVVFTVTAIIGTIGIASLSSYNHRQEVATATLDLRTLIEHARSLALSQVKPSDCSKPGVTSTLSGYEVDFCAGAALGRPLACNANDNDYEINALCPGLGYVQIASKKYSSALTITPTSRSYFFPIITGGVDHAGTITLSGYGVTQTITITSLGVVQ